MAATHCEFHLQASRWLLGYLLVVHLFAMAVAWWIAAPLLLQVIATLLVAASFLLAARGRHRHRVVLMVNNGQWRLRRGGDDREVTLMPPCYISRWLVVVPLGFSDGRRLRLLVPFDSLDPGQYRRLRAQIQLSVSG